MVAIVSGNSLGLELTSLGTVGDRGVGGLPGQGSSGEQVFVNAATGNLVVQHQDDFLASMGLDNMALRTYNSLGLASDDNGDNWSMGVYAQQMLLGGTVNQVGSTLTRTARDGSQAIYTWDATRSCYVTREGGGAYDTVIYNSGTLQYERTDGSSREVEKYSSTNGRLLSVTDSDGKSLTYTYNNTTGLLTSVADSSGETVSYEYTGTKLNKVKTQFKGAGGQTVTRSSVSYLYNSNRLSSVTVDLTPEDNSVTDGIVYTTSYTYEGTSKRVKTLTQSDGTSLTFGYVLVGTDYRIEKVTDALGAITRFAYNTATRRTTVTDQLGKVWQYDYDTAGQLTRLTQPLVDGVRPARIFAYDNDGNLLKVTSGDAESINYTYDGNGNCIQQVDDQSNYITRTFSATNQLLTETTTTLVAAPVINQGGVTVYDDYVVKSAGTDGQWDSAFRSSDPIVQADGSARISFRPTQYDKAFVIGLNTDPATNHSFDSIDYALYFDGGEDAHLQVRHNGQVIADLGPYSAWDQFEIEYAGGQITYSCNGDVLYTDAGVATGQAFYADSSFRDLGAQITELHFGDAFPLVAPNGVTVVDGAVRKFSGNQAWDASLRSMRSLDGYGKVTFSPAQVDRSFMMGLNSDPTADDSPTSLDWAFWCSDENAGSGLSNLYISESGVTTLVGTYKAGDTLIVSYGQDGITYWQNGTALKTVAGAGSGDLFLDSSFYHSDSRLTGVLFEREGKGNNKIVAIAQESAVKVAGDSANKIGGVDGVWDSAVRSWQGFTGGANVSFQTGRTDKALMIGLSKDPNASYDGSAIDWALLCGANGRLQASEKGQLIDLGTTYKVTDRLQVTYDGTAIRYLKNGVALRTVTVAVNQPLYLDSSFYNYNARVTNLRFGDSVTPELTTRFIYSATKPNQLSFAISPEGRVTRYVYDTHGQRTAQIDYPASLYGGLVNLKSNELPTEAQMTQWMGTQDPTKTTRKDFGYDARGLLSSVTEYEATLSNGNGNSATARTTTYIYDQAGRLLQTIAPSLAGSDEAGAAVSIYAYDGLGRLLSVKDAYGTVSSTVYTDSTQTAVVSYRGGAVATSVYDKAGRLISLARSANGSTTYAYDAGGHLLMSTDPTGVRTFFLYDAAGRRVASIDADGTLTEFVYDKSNRLTREVTYSTAVPLALLYGAGKPLNPTLESIRPESSSTDLEAWHVYDSAGRLTYEISDDGALTGFEYDGADRVLRTTRYVTHLYGADAPTTAWVWSEINSWTFREAASQDRVTRNFYDHDGLLAGSLDGEGGLTRNTYDADGRLVSVRRYATKITDEQLRLTGTIEAVTPANSSDDQVDSYFYDARGQMVGQVDAENDLTVNSYNERGQLRSQTRYSTPLSGSLVSGNPPLWTAKLSDLISSIRPGGTLQAQDRQSLRYYDLDGQLRSEVNFEGTTTRYEYDSARKLIKTTIGLGEPDARAPQARYDAWGRKTDELSAQAALMLVGETSPTAIDNIWKTYGSHYTYDAANRLTSVTDANQHKTLYYYDADGRLTHTIDAMGAVEERRYNVLGRLTTTIRYGNALASLSGLTGGLVTPALTQAVAGIVDWRKDSISSYDYDDSGRRTSEQGPTYVSKYTEYNEFGEVSENYSYWLIPDRDGYARNREIYTYDRQGRVKTTTRVFDYETLSTVTTERDAFGRVIKTDSNGLTHEWAYDRLGRVVQTINGHDPARVTTYDAFSQVLTTTDELQQTTYYTYNRLERSVTMQTPEGVGVTTVHTRYGQVLSVKDGNDVVTSYTYDLDGRLKETRVDGELVAHQDYDNGGRLVASFDARETKTSYTYDAVNRMLTRTVDPTVAGGDPELNLQTRWDYDAKGQAWRVTDPNGTVTEYSFYLDGRTASQTVDPDGLKLTTSWSYDSEGRWMTVVDANDVRTTYDYDPLGRVKQQAVAQRDEWGDWADISASAFTYDANGNVLSATKAGQLTRYRYDVNGRLEFTIDGAGGVTRHVYDGRGKLSRQIQYATLIGSTDEPTPTEPTSADRVTRFFYDDDARLQFTVDPFGALTRTDYDDNGNVTKLTRYADTLGANQLPADVHASDEDQVTLIEYDQFNRESWRADSAKGVTHSEYDKNGNLVKRTSYLQPLGVGKKPSQVTPTPGLDRVERFVYDAANRQTWRSDATGAVTRTEYEGNQVAQVTQFWRSAPGMSPDTVPPTTGLDRVSRFFYDDSGRLEYNVDAAGGVTQFEYDGNGNVVRQTRFADTLTAAERPDDLDVAAGSQVTRFKYDGLNRETWRANAMGEVTSTQYNGNGSVTSRTRYAATVAAGAEIDSVQANPDADRTEQFIYDDANRNTWWSDAAGDVTRTTYDAFGNVVEVVRFANTAFGASPDTVQPKAGEDRVTSYVYDAANHYRYEVDSLGYVTRLDYDAFGNVVASRRYADKPDSRATPSTARADNSLDRFQAFEYDGANRLLKSSDVFGATEVYTYDTAGNRLTYENKNKDIWTYTYDAVGRLLTETSPQVDLYSSKITGGVVDVSEDPVRASVITTMTYDSFGNVKTRTEATGRAGEERTTSYDYDLLGRQVKVTYPSFAVYNETLAELAANGRLGAVARDEVTNPIFVQTFYDSFGNAVSSIGVNGAVSYKSYDAAGRVTFEVDALGAVTGYERNAFGEATKVTRYGEVTTLNATPAEDAARLISTKSVSDAVNAAGRKHELDRVLINGYDLLGRIHSVVEPTVFVYDGASGISGLAGKETRSTYNAFGELIRVSQRAGIADTEWLDTFSYYDIGGRKTATVDAGGFLTTFDYDSEGNLKTQVEYAKALGANQWSEAGHADATPVEDEDRTTTWTWDRLNRKLSETKVHVKTYLNSTATNVNTAFYDLTTSYHYDAVGNLVWTQDSAGGKTYSFYDKLGRVRAVVAPTRLDQYGQLISPVTEFWRDAYGNVLCRIDRATSADIKPDESDYSVGDSGLDRFTKTKYDVAGHALQTEDAAGYQHYFSYTASGEMAKSWQTVTDIINGTRTPKTFYTAYKFDALGRLVSSYSPSPTEGETVSTDYRYNVFGELEARGKNGAFQESYLYDNAGRMWKTNTGDGYATVFLYDVLGRQTSEISSAGSGRVGAQDINTAVDAKTAAGRTDTRRINTEYNALGQVVVRHEAARGVGGNTAASSTVTVRDASVGATVAASAYPKWYEDPHPGRENMLVDMIGSNAVDLSWTTLAHLGSGDIRVDLTYLTKDTRFARYTDDGSVYYESGDRGTAPQRRTESKIFTGSEADDGVRLSWEETIFSTNGGISDLEKLVVYKRDANGDWVKVIDRDPQAGDYGTRIEVAAPTEAGASMALRYRQVGASQWINGALTQLGEGDDYWCDAAVTGRYEYEVLKTVDGGDAEVVQTGTFGELDTRKAVGSAHVLTSQILESEQWSNDSPTWYQWSGINSLSFGWASLAHLGSGDVRIDVSYQTSHGQGLDSATRNLSQTFAAGDAIQGVTLEWKDAASDLDSGIGGVTKINHFEVYKRDTNGNWVKVVDRNPSAGRGYGDYGTRVEIAAPAEANTAVGFRYRVVGTSQWINASLTKLGGTSWFDFSALSGNYEFEISETPQGGSAAVTRTGKFVGGKDGTSSSAAAAELVQPTVEFTRDRWGNALTQSDPRDSTWLTHFTYSRDNQVASEQRPDAFLGTLTNDSPTRHIYFDKLGRQRAVQDERGFVNTTEWDAGGNLVREVHADGGQVTYFYDAFGQRTRMVDAVGNGKLSDPNDPGSAIYREHTTRYTYDMLGRQLSTIHGNTTAGAVGVWEVDENNDYKLHSLGRKDLAETFEYDELGHKISSSNGANEKTTYRYDLAGNLIETRLPGGQKSTVRYTINADGGTTRTEIDANNNDASWTYDYFGKLIGHTDLGDAEYSYAYDNAGQLIRQTNVRNGVAGQNLRYTYDAAGGLIQIEDLAMHQTTSYVLDLAGRHLREKVVVNGEVFEDNHLAYDTLGRLIDSADNRAHLTFEYDAAGNRTHVTTHVLVAEVDDPDSETLQEESRYFVYDQMNRQTAVDAINVAGDISEDQGHQLTYDLNGNRLTDTFWGNVVKSTVKLVPHFNYETREVTYTSVPDYQKSRGYVLETYSYDALNRLETVDRDDTIVDVRSYDGAGRIVHSGPTNLPTDFAEKLNDDVPADQQIGMEVRSMQYDVNGRLLFQRTWKSNGTTNTYDIDYHDDGFYKGYDAVGNALHYRVVNYGSEDFTTNITLDRFEGYVESVNAKTGSQSGTGRATSTYDVNGYLVDVDDQEKDSFDKQMVNDAAGRVLRVTQDGHKLWTHMVNGQIMGRYGVGPNEIDPRTKHNNANFQQVADFEFGYRSISGSYPAAGVGGYTVRQGDSLQAIAQAAYGDSSQWWRIAQANGLQSDRDLRVGQTLSLPSAVSGTSNNEGTFKPYNPSDVIGDTSPNLPAPKQGGCGAVGMIIMIVVAVVVTVFTAGVASMGIAAAMQAGMGAVMTAGGAALAGGSIGAAMVGAAVGSIVSQGVGIAIGAQESFSWKQVAVSTVSAGVTAGVGSALSGAGAMLNNVVVRTAISSALTQGISVTVGLQKTFSWRNVAASTVGSMVGQGVSTAIGGAAQTVFGEQLGKIVTGTVAGMASGATVAAMRGGKVAMQQVAADAFGNALGGSIVDSMRSVDWQRAPDQLDAEWERLKRGQVAALNQDAADNRTKLNTFNSINDREYFGSIPGVGDGSNEWDELVSEASNGSGRRAPGQRPGRSDVVSVFAIAPTMLPNQFSSETRRLYGPGIEAFEKGNAAEQTTAETKRLISYQVNGVSLPVVRPVFDEQAVKFTLDQQLKINKSLDNLEAGLTEKLQELTVWDNRAKVNFYNSYGTIDDTAKAVVVERVLAVLELAKAMTVENFRMAEQLDRSDDDFAKLAGYVHRTDGEHTVFLGPRYWAGETSGLNSDWGVLAHELSHFEGPTRPIPGSTPMLTGTVDGFVDPATGREAVYPGSTSVDPRVKYYGPAMSEMMLKGEQTLYHADTFEFYVEGTAGVRFPELKLKR